ncbi:hypothetical protein [Eleftheria terrae]|uniref:hypothetical protein n=1 Tax=Eleftheria terrae TaxID=1597781 RepID=UPI00263B98B1|nr:hypothetical protein [Eleftheria terrae]WKB52372.1 hypothetical protein N7L95_21655 [Eleftheria terrae]
MSPRLIRLKALAAGLLALAAGMAQAAPAIAPGEYLTEHGWGQLTVRPGTQGRQRFELQTEGGNAHVCELGGEILPDGRLHIDGSDADEPPCHATARLQGRGVAIAHDDADACRQWCGARARFEGLYLKPAAGCTLSEVGRSRAEATRHYKAGRHAQARARLESLLADCSATLGWVDTHWIRNDLALTQYKLGDLAACLKTLEPLAADAAKSDAALREEWVSPVMEDSYLGPVRAARTNLRLCRGEGGRTRP